MVSNYLRQAEALILELNIHGLIKLVKLALLMSHLLLFFLQIVWSEEENLWHCFMLATKEISGKESSSYWQYFRIIIIITEQSNSRISKFTGQHSPWKDYDWSQALYPTPGFATLKLKPNQTLLPVRKELACSMWSLTARFLILHLLLKLDYLY